MIDYIIIFSNEHSVSEVRDYLIAIGGKWRFLNDLNQINIHDKLCNTLYVDLYKNLNDFDKRELKIISSKLRSEPSFNMFVRIGTSKLSSYKQTFDFAKGFAKSINDHFDSVIWDDQEVFDAKDHEGMKIIKD